MENRINDKELLNLAFSSAESFRMQIDTIITQLLSQANTKDILKKSLTLLDITTLNDEDYKNSIVKIISQSTYSLCGIEGAVAGICIYSNLLPILREFSLDKRVRKVVVSGGFPTGQLSLEAKIKDIQFALENGADEIDIPINRGLFFENPTVLGQEIKEIKQQIDLYDKVRLKVILETSQLRSYENVYKASMIAMNNGADFIKTSTGKTKQGADIYSSAVMIMAIKEFLSNNPDRVVGFKAAGGIRNSEQVLQYYSLMRYFFSEKYINQDTFRIGCSSLRDNLINNLTK